VAFGGTEGISTEHTHVNTHSFIFELLQ